MSNQLKKHGFSLSVPRFFTRHDRDAYELIHFREPEAVDEEMPTTLEHPDNWSAESTALLAQDAAYASVPNGLKLVEENTVPSWLWRHSGGRKNSESENSVGTIFTRVVGAAAYKGWKLDIFSGETSARAFFDEARYAMAQRFIAFEPRDLKNLGLDWAYGVETQTTHTMQSTAHTLEISNTVIDAIIGGSRDKAIRATWQRATRAQPKTPASLRFADVAGDWDTGETRSMNAALNLMAFRHNDGTVNIETLRHAVRMIVIMQAMHQPGKAALAIGFSNLAPLLMALALPFDTETGRATAAAISAIITAEAYAVSAELAALLGMSPAFAANREVTLRTLRNRRRAAYGDQNDYEKISVLPAPLALSACPDLALAAAARTAWDRALELAQTHGVRHTHVTALSASPSLALFMESTSQGIEPLRTLIVTQPAEADLFRREINPSVIEGLMRLGYTQTQSRAIAQHIAGAGTLEKAPIINHASLRAKGFDAEALQRLEGYLPYVDKIRMAFTPWILGEKFCRTVLKIPAAKIQNPRLDLLAHLGFSATDVAAANLYCYGHDSVKDAPGLKPQHAATFARNEDVSPAAHVRMAAAVQSFISGAIGLHLSLPAGIEADKVEKLLLSVWRQGVQSVHIDYEAPAAEAKAARVVRPSKFQNVKPSTLPARRAKPKATAHAVTAAAKAKSKTARRSWGRR